MVIDVSIIDDKILYLPFDINLYLRGDILDILIGALSLYISFRAITISLSTSKIQSELQGYQMLAEEKRTYLSLIAQGANESKSTKDNASSAQDNTAEVLEVAFENLCNAYDIFCGKYLAREVNKKRFVSDYAREIINWVDAFPDTYGHNSDLPNTVKAYMKIKNIQQRNERVQQRKEKIIEFFTLSLPADDVEELNQNYQEALNKLYK